MAKKYSVIIVTLRPNNFVDVNVVPTLIPPQAAHTINYILVMLPCSPLFYHSLRFQFQLALMRCVGRVSEVQKNEFNMPTATTKSSATAAES
jgi:hypothetical protein